jgi:hypothetical protein
MARLSSSDTYIGITTRLDNYEYDARSGRATPEVRVSYLDTDNVRRIVNICPYGARTLAKALNAMADKADPPRKKRS